MHHRPQGGLLLHQNHQVAPHLQKVPHGLVVALFLYHHSPSLTRKPSLGQFRTVLNSGVKVTKGSPFMRSPSGEACEIMEDTIEGYEMLKTVGKGSFCKVRQAIHTKTGEKVAIKCVEKQGNAEGDSTAQMIERELSIMKLLRHPNIITLYQVMETEDYIYIIMEYASNGEIMEYINTHGPLSEAQTKKFFFQLADAVHYMHSQNACHRDLKAANLLLDDNLNLKIIDFGFSHTYEQGGKFNTFCGSPSHVSPQLVQRQEYDGPAADVWSMGVVLYNIVCGTLPFEADSIIELFKKIVSADYTIPETVSPECRELIEKMLLVDPRERWTDEQILQCEYLKGMKREEEVIQVTKGEELNEDVMLYLELDVGFDYNAVKASVQDKKYDYNSTAYYLMAQRKKKTAEEETRKAASAISPCKPRRTPSLSQLRINLNSPSSSPRLSPSSDSPRRPFATMRHQMRSTSPTFDLAALSPPALLSPVEGEGSSNSYADITSPGSLRSLRRVVPGHSMTPLFRSKTSESPFTERRRIEEQPSNPISVRAISSDHPTL
ncbi:MAP/microtubule affinity-regulating kinase 3-like [Planoprotostelium fungivorum]|uniref:MAP/microtubule affinity-regulating kinase 3-like n=1 Tax=Planoprotostelium fungivorum TaxID=1890364 RepID=A0A2P6NTB7_9EUKA|nr:MAP/microtubule affinity-regulating kinase 3-like [Planoprotostelium fungivorum]